MDIVLYPDEPLGKKAERYRTVGPEVAKLASEMFEIMAVYDGCGLAGPQVGVLKAIIVIHLPETEEDYCLVNPEILESEGSETAEEGCLSLPRIYAPVTRCTRIRVRTLDKEGHLLDFEATGLLARIIQHECDHLQGLIFLDRVDLLTREAKLQEWAEVREQMMSALTGR